MVILRPAIFGSVSTCDMLERSSRTFSHQLNAKLLVRHFAAAKLQLNTHLVAAVQEFFGVPDFRHIIVLVDVNAELDFLQFRAGRLFILRVFGNVVSELSEIDDLAHRRIRRGRDFDQIFDREFELYARRRLIS